MAPDVVCDLGGAPWPWPDNSVDEAVASHVLEHLTTAQLFHFMRECYRVMKAGAILSVTLPHPQHDLFLGDPTHQRPVMPGTLAMFSKRYFDDLAGRGLHITPFWKLLGVDFYLEPRIAYVFEAGVDPSDPDLEWKCKHLNNIIREWSGKLRVEK